MAPCSGGRLTAESCSSVEAQGVLSELDSSMGSCHATMGRAGAASSEGGASSASPSRQDQCRPSRGCRAPGVWTTDLGVLGCVASPGVSADVIMRRMECSSKNESQEEERLRALLRGAVKSRGSRWGGELLTVSSGNSCFSVLCMSSAKPRARACRSMAANCSPEALSIFFTRLVADSSNACSPPPARMRMYGGHSLSASPCVKAQNVRSGHRSRSTLPKGQESGRASIAPEG
mmetsp:Transcript_70964/g.207963  ORF Transcript_70964/g.207963 Transcript_70964/m.207963 type:complete len:233 (+) Transcript_70964:1975-2673(+)